MYQPPNDELWLGVLTLDPCHHARTNFLVYNVDHFAIHPRTLRYFMPIQIIDLFAGPGGLGEGFSALDKGAFFQIALSAEMESSAHSTLRMRSYYRHLKKYNSDLAPYYAFCNGTAERDAVTRSNAWREACDEARQITLGTPDGNAELDHLLNLRIDPKENCVLIGGPPCQAYSLVGRSRNVGKADYKAEDDHRHFLYKEYLRIIHARSPAIFVMENVKGILSSKVNGEKIFNSILRDLSNPSAALKKVVVGPKYRIHSLVHESCYEHGMAPQDIDPRNFIVKAEEHGIPQARHRVILLGIREDLPREIPLIKKQNELTCVSDAISELPALRSRLSRETDSSSLWANVVIQHNRELADDAAKLGHKELSKELADIARNIKAGLGVGSMRLARQSDFQGSNTQLGKWLNDTKLKVWLNNETRGHMTSDLRRYAFAAAFARSEGFSPKGHNQFHLDGLRPNHENWESGKFADRFRVQMFRRPATTITSHIAKDGHYFIHPDATQCRSLTVREAARLQTFPDNYLFEGNRTQQFHQVGNAVPPYLAYQIAKVVKQILKNEAKNATSPLTLK